MSRKNGLLLSRLFHQPLERRDALKLIGKTSLIALLASACGHDTPAKPIAPPKRPNIIYLHTHDSGALTDLRGGYRADFDYGSVNTAELPAHVPLPWAQNLFRFGSEGIIFRNAFSAAPTCSPSRAALMTGMTPGCNGMWGLAPLGYDLNDYSQTLVHFLNQAGYTSALVGVQHIADGTPQECAKRIGYHKLLPSKGRLAKDIADAAIDFLEQPPKEPFFLDIGFAETHLLPDGESRFGYAHGDPDYAFVPLQLDDGPETRRDMADLRLALDVLDVAIGRVLDALDRTGLRESTLVIITTDHGIPLPGMKGNHTDKGLEVMLMMRGPKSFLGARIGPGTIIPALVSQIDIFPTICDWLNLELPAWLQGKSLMPIIRGQETGEINEAIYAEHESHAALEPQASVRTKRYKYIRRLDGNPRVRPNNADDTFTRELWLREGWAERTVALEQLYDLETDPLEKNNLAYEPTHADKLDEMRKLMVARMEQYDNPLLRRYNVRVGPPERLEPPTNFTPNSNSSERDEIGLIYTSAL